LLEGRGLDISNKILLTKELSVKRILPPSSFRLGVGKTSFAQAVLVLLNGSLPWLRLLAHCSTVHNGPLREPFNLVISLFNLIPTFNFFLKMGRTSITRQQLHSSYEGSSHIRGIYYVISRNLLMCMRRNPCTCIHLCRL
jgi:hypothetical protein